MKLTRTTLVVPLAGLLLVAAAGVVAATFAGSDPGPSSGVVLAAPSPSPSAGTGTTTDQAPRDTLLSDVLDGLVTSGTISDAQRTKILAAVDSARTARRDAARAQADQLRTFLADGVITQQEFDQLPADSRLRQVATLMDDGKITLDELRSALGGRGGFGGRGGHGFGGGLFGGHDGSASPNASPSASPTTGG